MADRRAGPGPGPTTPPRVQRPRGGNVSGRPTLLQKLHDHMPNSAQVVGFLTLVISGGILLLLTGLSLTATVMGLIFFTPLILLTSPMWVPAGAVLFVAVAGFLSAGGVGVAVLAGASWMFKYFRGSCPPGSGRVDYARGRIADTAREYGGYFQSKAKDAAPGA